MLANQSPLASKVIGCAIEVHRAVGPGLIEGVYEACLMRELFLQGVAFRRQVAAPLSYKGACVDARYRADLLVDNSLLIEVKSIDRILRVHRMQVLTYLRLLDLHHALLINFNCERLVEGVRSIIR